MTAGAPSRRASRARMRGLPTQACRGRPLGHTFHVSLAETELREKAAW
jgi:hypothetical protein